MLWKGWRAYGDTLWSRTRTSKVQTFLLLWKLAPPPFPPPAVYISNIFLCLFSCFVGRKQQRPGVRRRQEGSQVQEGVRRVQSQTLCCCGKQSQERLLRRRGISPCSYVAAAFPPVHMSPRHFPLFIWRRGISPCSYDAAAFPHVHMTPRHSPCSYDATAFPPVLMTPRHFPLFIWRRGISPCSYDAAAFSPSFSVAAMRFLPRNLFAMCARPPTLVLFIDVMLRIAAVHAV